jgi:predicted nucleic acid-binding protein
VSYLVDTNVFAAVMTEQPDPLIYNWLTANQAELYTSSLTIGEITVGVERLPAGRKRSRLQAGLNDLVRTMGDRILRFDTRVALVWGKLRADLARAGRVIQVEDTYIAAVALRHQLTVATRNSRDFERAGVRTLNPFENAKAS